MSRVHKFKKEGRRIKFIAARDEFFVLDGEHPFYCMRLQLRIDFNDLFCDRCMLVRSKWYFHSTTFQSFQKITRERRSSVAYMVCQSVLFMAVRSNEIIIFRCNDRDIGFCRSTGPNRSPFQQVQSFLPSVTYLDILAWTSQLRLGSIHSWRRNTFTVCST